MSVSLALFFAGCCLVVASGILAATALAVQSLNEKVPDRLPAFGIILAVVGAALILVSQVIG